MHVDNFDALRIWLTKVLTHICEAEPATLSKYVCILVKKDVKGRDPKGFFTEQLEVFLQDETSGFIDKLFKALESKEYMSEEIMSELNERKEKKDKKRTKSEKSEKGIEKSGEKAVHHSHRHRQLSRHSQNSNGGGAPGGGAGDSERHGAFPSPTRLRTPSPAPRRHRQAVKSRSRSPVHRRRRDSREGHNERNNHCDSDLSANPISVASSILPPSLTTVQLYDSSHPPSLRLANQQTGKAQQVASTTINAITPLMSASTAYNPQPKPVTALRVNAPSTTTVGYTPSVGPSPPRTRQRCRDFDEKGFCMRGDLCPFDHGVDPVVVENVNLTKVLAFPTQQPPPKPSTVEQPPPPQPPQSSSSRREPEEPRRDEEEQTEISTVQPQDRGRPRPVIVRPPGNVSRNIVEVPLVDDRPEVPTTASPEKAEGKEPSKDGFEWRGVRFSSNGNINNNISLGESSCVDLRTRLGGAGGGGGGRGGRGGGFRERRGFHHSGGNRGGGHMGGGSGGGGMEGSCSLGVSQIPPELNAIGPLNQHFSQFGEVKNIQTAYQDDPRSALVTFKTPADALKAYRSPEPILSNRFIRTHLHNDTGPPNWTRGRGRGRGLGRGMDTSGHRVPVKRRLGYGCGANEGTEEAPSGGGGRSPKRRLHHRLGRNFDESSSESDDDWGVPEQDAEPRRHVVIDDSNAGDDDVTTSGLSMQEAMEEARHKEEVAQRQEVAAQMRAQQLQALEKVRKKKELRVQKVLLYNKAREQLKFLMKKSNDYPADSPLKSKIQVMVGSVEERLAEMEKELDVDQEATKQIQVMQRRCLETEYEVYSKEQNKQDATEPKRRLAEMHRRVEIMKEKAAAGAGLFPSRGQTKLDKRPRSLFISAINDDVSTKAVLHNICCNGVAVEKYEYLENDKRLHLTCRTRQDAEYISNHMHTYKGKPLRIEWAPYPAEKSASSSDPQTNKSCGSPPREGSASTKPPETEEANGGAEDEAGAEDGSFRGETSGQGAHFSAGDDSAFLEGDPVTMDDMDDGAFDDEYDPDYDEDYDPEYDPNFENMSPVVIAANSDSSDNDDDDEDGDEEEGEEEEEDAEPDTCVL